MTLGEMTLVVAREKLGIKEATGKNDGPFIQMVQRWVARGASWLDNQPWCACFATWCVSEAAKRLGMKAVLPRNASSSSLYRWFKANNFLLAKPEPYCVGLLRGGPTGHRHTFLVGGPEPIDGEYVWSIDGNWANAVSRTKHKISECDFGKIV